MSQINSINPSISQYFSLIRSHALGMWRFRWGALIIAWIFGLIGWTLVYSLPNTYQANARVYVDTENAIKDFLAGVSQQTDVMNEIALVIREMLSRPNLEQVANDTGLAVNVKSERQLQALLTALQNRISVSGSRDGTFTISFSDSNRQKAIAVVESLLVTFVENSLGEDRLDSANAQKFLQDQIRQYETRLTQAEDRLANFKRENVKFMPDQKGDYFSRLQAAETALQTTIGKLSIATERRAELGRQIAGEEPVFGIMSSTSQSEGSGGQKSAKLRELEQQLAELRLQYTDKHPRIGQILDTIAMIEKQEAAEARERAAMAAERPLEQNPLDLNPVYQNMRIQLSTVDVEIASLRAEQSQQQQEVARLRTMVDTIPQVEAELKRLNRDYEVVGAKHQQLVRQLETATIGDDASRTMDDVQFRIIEPPFSDVTPAGPNRPFLLFAVLVIALGFGGLSALIRNQLDPVLIGSRSVVDALGIPVLASVSLMQSSQDLRRERRGRWAIQAAAASLLIVFVAITAYSGPGSILLRSLMSSPS